MDSDAATALDPRVSADPLDLEKRLRAVEQELASRRKDDRVCLICFSGEWDRLFAALTIANGAAAMGQEVHLFFTFWAMSALRRQDGSEGGSSKSMAQRLLGLLLPRGMRKARLSRMNCFGIGKAMMKQLMKKNGVSDLDALQREAIDLGVKFHLCDTTFCLFGLRPDDLEVGKTADVCGVATFLALALTSKVVLFI